jgi:hypothetical protein
MHTPINTLKTAVREREATTVVDVVRRIFDLEKKDLENKGLEKKDLDNKNLAVKGIRAPQDQKKDDKKAAKPVSVDFEAES